MALTVKKIALWRKEVENGAGILAGALAPLAHAGANIHVVMAYRYPGQESKGAIELYPVTGKKSATEPRKGVQRVRHPALLVEGDNRAALAMRPRRPSPTQESAWIFLWPRL